MSKAGWRGAAHDALQATEERFRALFEKSPISIREEDFSEVERLLVGLRRAGVGDPESLGTFRRKFVAIREGKTELVSDAVVRTLANERRDVTVHFAVSPGHEWTLSRVVVPLVDVHHVVSQVDRLRDRRSRA